MFNQMSYASSSDTGCPGAYLSTAHFICASLSPAGKLNEPPAFHFAFDGAACCTPTPPAFYFHHAFAAADFALLTHVELLLATPAHAADDEEDDHGDGAMAPGTFSNESWPAITFDSNWSKA